MLFLGTYNHIIDEKNRLSLPAKLVAKFSHRIVVASKGFEGCLELRSQEDFEV
ncbi:MAG: MraZ N-terminal domain containing protein [Mycoplasmoidaceae bacterium]|nr:MraZ N-terminal domain containing protein [Mycoplasmoidaceae bacterium]